MTQIDSERIVKSYVYGDTIELTTANGLQEQTIKVIEGRRYVNLQTGEIFYMDTSNQTRLDNLKSTKQTMKKLRRLVAHNFTGGSNQLWVTLTYREHVTSPTLIYKDFKAFIRKLRASFGNVEYIAVIEPQASGRWHLHVLLKNDSTLLIPNEDMAKLWSKGFTKTKRLRRADKVGNYLIAYLSNLQIGDENSTNKAIVKGARLYMYPKGIRIFRTSRGIEKPLEVTATKGELMEVYKINCLPNFSRTTRHETPYGMKEYTTEFYDNVKSLSDTFSGATDKPSK
ncbi:MULTISPECIES: rolling circle replication-associated protein [Streptococcus]|uniref:rolling circle replication-associated protein n=1 Tax=Streptococcus TaxID=1301 RepID=UPI000F6F0242|nr:MULTISPECIES: replicative protein [Streptococcus]MCW1059250.1 replicative protein [Streptococcus anginosus]MDU3555374.1 replicative protein [Streptococcus anginosus]MDX5004569.1 replicative protein [Streptococcus anginosus]MDX5026054.1 replicative protein [Streptococcus anginosus]MDX5034061.1 replicative protein [Streptococcus anginosus]